MSSRSTWTGTGRNDCSRERAAEFTAVSTAAATWVSLERAVGAQFRTYVVTQDPRSANVVYAGTSTGLLQSPDGGRTWRRLSPRMARSIAFDPTDPRRIFVATDQGILRSEDGGTHFMEANQGLGNLEMPAESSGASGHREASNRQE